MPHEPIFSKKKTVLIILIIISSLLVGGGIFFLVKKGTSASSSSEKPNKQEKNDKPNNPPKPTPKSPGDKPDKPKDDFPEPSPGNNDKWKFVANKINDNTFKYQITLDGGEIDFSDFITLLKDKKEYFFKAFQGALKDANSKFPAYFWKCLPVSQKTLDKPFEFVVIKSEALNNIAENSSGFEEYLAENNYHDKPAFISFPNKPGSGKPSDAILVIPSYIDRYDQKHYDFKNISTFTKNASEEQQQEFWKGVAENLMKELEKSDAPRWLNTHGLGVHYLHVRIDEEPKYYGDYIKYKYL